MKRTVLLTVLLLLIIFLLCGCFSNVMIIPDKDYLGEAEKFEKDGFEITLTDKFKEEQSELGFDAYFVSNFCGVVVLKEEFALEKGLSEQSLETYIGNVITNNGHTGITPQTKDGLWFYERTSNNSYAQVYCYKGSDAFWIVQFLCSPSDAQTLNDTFYLLAQSVNVN